MAKHFQFDDEDEIVEENTINIDREDKKNSKKSQKKDSQNMAKKKKNFQWKWWHYLLIGLGVLFVAFSIYIFAASRNNGPVYGHRGDGIVEITETQQNDAVAQMKKQYSEIQSLDLEVRCKQVRLNIQFEDKMSTKKAKSIAEDCVRILDKVVGRSKVKDSKYSELFGKIQNVPQYEVNLILKSNGNKDFPIFGTKHTGRDQFSYTLASVKDKKSHDQATDTLKDKE